MGRLLLMQCPVAGFQFHFGERCWTQLHQGDALVLRREPGNRHDVRAVRIEWDGRMLGYVPREANYAVSQMMDRGITIEAWIVALRVDTNPWNRVMIELAALVDAPASTGPNPVRYDAREEPAAKRPQPIVLSLANRIFTPPASASEVAWTLEHAGALALVGIEHSILLPFFRLFLLHDALMLGTDACSALRNLVEAAGLEAAAWKRLEKWGFGTFRRFVFGETHLRADHVAAYGNFLLRLDVKGPPPQIFSQLAWQCAAHGGSFEPMMLDSFPVWFMRALLRECEAATASSREEEIAKEFAAALEWAVGTNPAPDPNQQHAGWSWIMERAKAYAAKLEARAWPVPIGDLIRAGHVVVPIRNAVELREEAQAMSNCLANYEEACCCGIVHVFSIRTRVTGKSVACFALTREADRWVLVQVVGKANAPVSPEIDAIALEVLAKVARTIRSNPSG